MAGRDVRERFEQALELAELAEQMIEAQIRREHPHESPGEIAELVERKMCDRPGAELGDAVGRVVKLAFRSEAGRIRS
jgi:hypothetical protein